MSQTQTQAQAPAVAERDVIYMSAGTEIKLNKSIVRSMLVKGDSAKVSEQDINQFICMCKFNELNPFLNEAYLIKFGQQSTQMIVSKEAYFKRADACPNFAGIKSGVIVARNNEILELEGNFVAPGDTLLGGWAEVYRTDRKFPIVAKVNLKEYDKNQSVWNTMKSTMISKTAKVQALREAFPSQLGAMYTKEEQTPFEDAEAVEILDAEKAQAYEQAEEIVVESPEEVQQSNPVDNSGQVQMAF